MIFSNKDNIDNFDKITLRSYGKYMWCDSIKISIRVEQ
jgi:hypothetical protein